MLHVKWNSQRRAKWLNMVLWYFGENCIIAFKAPDSLIIYNFLKYLKHICIYNIICPSSSIYCYQTNSKITSIERNPNVNNNLQSRYSACGYVLSQNLLSNLFIFFTSRLMSLLGIPKIKYFDTAIISKIQDPYP